MKDAEQSQITQLLVQWKHGSQQALDALMPVFYPYYFRRERPEHTIQSAAFVNNSECIPAIISAQWPMFPFLCCAFLSAQKGTAETRAISAGGCTGCTQQSYVSSQSAASAALNFCIPDDVSNGIFHHATTD